MKKETVKNNKFTLRFRAVNRDIFDAIKSGKKRIETRAGSTKYKDIKTGDKLVFVCGKDKLEKSVKKVFKFRSIDDLHKKFKPSEINPNTKTIAESKKVYYSFSGYRDKIKKYGLIAIQI